MTKENLKIVKKQLKNGKQTYPFMELSIEECYRLYDKENITVEKESANIDYLNTTQLRDCIVLGCEQ